jgi:hypothetical protein
MNLIGTFCALQVQIELERLQQREDPVGKAAIEVVDAHDDPSGPRRA